MAPDVWPFVHGRDRQRPRDRLLYRDEVVIRPSSAVYDEQESRQKHEGIQTILGRGSCPGKGSRLSSLAWHGRFGRVNHIATWVWVGILDPLIILSFSRLSTPQMFHKLS